MEINANCSLHREVSVAPARQCFSQESDRDQRDVAENGCKLASPASSAMARGIRSIAGPFSRDGSGDGRCSAFASSPLSGEMGVPRQPKKRFNLVRWIDGEAGKLLADRRRKLGAVARARRGNDEAGIRPSI